MIVEYDSSGRITHIIKDPVPQHMADFMTRNGKTFLNLPPTPWDPEPQFDSDTGKLIVDEDGTIVMASNGVDYADCDLMRDYVLDGQITRRPECPAVITVAQMAVRITDLPKGARVTIMLDNVAVDVDATEVEFDEAGPIAIRVVPPWPYLEAVHDIEIE